jgi:hypothetical protein
MSPGATARTLRVKYASKANIQVVEQLNAFLVQQGTLAAQVAYLHHLAAASAMLDAMDRSALLMPAVMAPAMLASTAQLAVPAPRSLNVRQAHMATQQACPHQLAVASAALDVLDQAPHCALQPGVMAHAPLATTAQLAAAAPRRMPARQAHLAIPLACPQQFAVGSVVLAIMELPLHGQRLLAMASAPVGALGPALARLLPPAVASAVQGDLA